MSNYKGHFIGGCIAYTAVSITLICIVTSISKVPTELTSTKYSILIHIPKMLTYIEQAIHNHFPHITSFLAHFITNIWPWLLTALEFFFFTIAGAMFPDIDIKSKSQKYLYSTFFVALLILIGKKEFKTVAFLSTLSCMPIFATHRGLFHRLWFVILITFICWCWLSMLLPAFTTTFSYYALFFVAGAISHLWLDMGVKRMLRI